MHQDEIHNALNLHTIWGLSAFYFKFSPDKLKINSAGGHFQSNNLSKICWVVSISKFSLCQFIHLIHDFQRACQFFNSY